MKKVIALLALLCVAVFAQQKGSFTDPRDKKTYQTVKIGNQTWMAQNLDYHGTDGFLGLCYGDQPLNKIRKPENCQKYGRLYDWEEAMKACPSGWHLPEHKEWQTLVDLAGGEKIAGKKLKAKSGWREYDFSESSPRAPKCKWTEEKIDGRGRVTVTEHDKCPTDEYGFSALPGGVGGSGGSFNNVDNLGSWWSSSESGSGYYAYDRNMNYKDEDVRWSYGVMSHLFSVRCVQDVAAAFAQQKGSFTDPRDKKTYQTVKIGTQTWMAENLNYAEKDSKCADNKPANCSKYGRLYDWEEAMKACPKGWHLPSDDEWKTLVDFAGGYGVAGKKLKAKNGWNNGGNGTDIYGFSALPGGNGDSDGSFNEVGGYGYWWSASEYEDESGYAYGRIMLYRYEHADWDERYESSNLFSVRCLQD